MKKFIEDIKEVGRDIKAGMYFVRKRCCQLPWWIGEVINRKSPERKIKYFTPTASDISRSAYDD